ncbi:MAG TPA: lysophospholipid acyltransferase family protein [Cyclobacteriaceae bacterium]|nr:lysophospholipid acyltransferase family protein [Cyclobacteriaceae bacterium]
MKTPLWYKLLKAYTKICLHLYFRKIGVQGLDNVPENEPVLFVSNHQNAFLDALLVLTPLKRSPWYLARADAFGKPWLKKVLTAFRIMPVYRFRDGFSTLKNNEIIFAKCAELLNRNECLLMFGEGNHGEQWCLRPLQKGFARIAFIAASTSDWQNKLSIVPVGLQYEKREEMQSRVLVSYGKPINVADFKDAYEQHHTEGINALISSTSAAMQKLIVHIAPEEDYDRIANQLHHKRVIHHDLAKQLAADQQLVEEIKKTSSAPSYQINEIKKNRFWKWFNPVLIYGFLNNLITYLVQQALVKKVRDQQFKPSLYFLAGMLILPLTIIFQSIAFHLITQDWQMSLLYAFSIPLSGILGYRFYKM